MQREIEIYVPDVEAVFEDLIEQAFIDGQITSEQLSVTYYLTARIYEREIPEH